jgi:glutaredoxin/glutathione-dependent peroxiredoxin
VVSVGDRIPDVEVHTMGPDGPVAHQSAEILGQGKVVLIGVPGAFTRGCSRVHLPGYISRLRQLREAGVDLVACTAVNDPWVMDAWSNHLGADGILMLADGTAAFAAAMGVTVEIYPYGTRSQRYAAVIDDGMITSLDVEPTRAIDVSSCENILANRVGAAAEA